MQKILRFPSRYSCFTLQPEPRLFSISICIVAAAWKKDFFLFKKMSASNTSLRHVSSHNLCNVLENSNVFYWRVEVILWHEWRIMIHLRNRASLILFLWRRGKNCYEQFSRLQELYLPTRSNSAPRLKHVLGRESRIVSFTFLPNASRSVFRHVDTQRCLNTESHEPFGRCQRPLEGFPEVCLHRCLQGLRFMWRHQCDVNQRQVDQFGERGAAEWKNWPDNIFWQRSCPKLHLLFWLLIDSRKTVG